MISNQITLIAAEDGYRRDRARREIADAHRTRRIRRARRSGARRT